MKAAAIPLLAIALAFMLFGCVTQQQQGNQTNQTATLLPPAASLRPHVTTPSPYPTEFPSTTPAPFLECASDSDCVVSGSSNEVCAKKTYETPQAYKPEFECLKLTSCGCNNSTCGWKQNDDYKQCLKTNIQTS